MSLLRRQPTKFVTQYDKGALRAVPTIELVT